MNGLIEKLLANSAQECQRLNADHWRLALSNGHLMTVFARRDEEFLKLDADAQISLTAEKLPMLAYPFLQLPGTVKLALRRGSSGIRLRGEIPLPEETTLAGERIGDVLDGMRSMSHRLHEWDGNMAAASTDPLSDTHATPGILADLLSEVGWQTRERPGGALLADLETGSRFLQAEVEPLGAGACFRLTLYRDEATREAARLALSLYLLEANAALCYATAFLRRTGEGTSAGFEVCLQSRPTAVEVRHALGALSVAGRHCAKEIEVLMKDGALAGIYRSALPKVDQQSKKGA
jgi:hypothetical protein